MRQAAPFYVLRIGVHSAHTLFFLQYAHFTFQNNHFIFYGGLKYLSQLQKEIGGGTDVTPGYQVLYFLLYERDDQIVILFHDREISAFGFVEKEVMDVLLAKVFCHFKVSCLISGVISGAKRIKIKYMYK